MKYNKLQRGIEHYKGGFIMHIDPPQQQERDNYKLVTAFQDSQWAYVVKDITAQGFSTGLLHFEDKHY